MRWTVLYHTRGDVWDLAFAPHYLRECDERFDEHVTMRDVLAEAIEKWLIGEGNGFHFAS